MDNILIVSLSDVVPFPGLIPIHDCCEFPYNLIIRNHSLAIQLDINARMSLPDGDLRFPSVILPGDLLRIFKTFINAGPTIDSAISSKGLQTYYGFSCVFMKLAALPYSNCKSGKNILSCLISIASYTQPSESIPTKKSCWGFSDTNFFRQYSESSLMIMSSE
jgi:hypothetical protein